MVFILGCAGVTPQGRLAFQAGTPAQHAISNVPFIPQENNQCGPAALAIVLQYHNASVTMDEMTSQVYTPSLEGSIQPALISAARRNGFVAHVIHGTENLFQEISNGSPVIVLQNLGFSWCPVWHYAVVTGYDVEENFVLLHSGLTPHRRVSFRVFDRAWSGSRHWGLVVLPPTKVPVTATEMSYIESVAGLERANQRQSAIIGYETALTRWPGSLYARLALGNCYYEAGNLESAAEVLREATRLSPDSAIAFNNLAQVLFEQGKGKEALVAAARAVALGGAMQSVYRETYEEIRSQLH